MSITKRVWIELDPHYAAERKRIMDEAWERTKQFPHRLADTRFEMVNGKRKKDRFWGLSLSSALRELDADIVCINGGVFFRSEVDLNRTKDLAERHLAEWKRPRTPEEVQASRETFRLRKKNTILKM